MGKPPGPAKRGTAKVVRQHLVLWKGGDNGVRSVSAEAGGRPGGAGWRPHSPFCARGLPENDPVALAMDGTWFQKLDPERSLGERRPWSRPAGAGKPRVPSRRRGRGLHDRFRRDGLFWSGSVVPGPLSGVRPPSHRGRSLHWSPMT